MNEIDDHIIEGLIGLGYDLRIFDTDGKYPGGLDRDSFERQEIDKLLSAFQQVIEADVEKVATESVSQPKIDFCHGGLIY